MSEGMIVFLTLCIVLGLVILAYSIRAVWREFKEEKRNAPP
jgi:hypothetical protein